VLLVGVPYALKAADADTLGGRSASAYVTTESASAGGVVSTCLWPENQRYKRRLRRCGFNRQRQNQDLPTSPAAGARIMCRCGQAVEGGLSRGDFRRLS